MPSRNRMRRRRERQARPVPAPTPVPKPAPKPVPKPVPAPEVKEPAPKPAPVIKPAAPVTNAKYGGKTRQQWWETRFPEVPVLYRAQDRNLRDVRNYIFDKSYLFDQVISKYKLKGRDDNETVYKCLMFVISNFKYVGDEEARNQPEFWQYPEDSLTRGTGDCEDGAILLKSLSMACGVPDWKVKVQAGMVKGGGHAYCTYIRDDDTQCIMDWCYWPNKLPINSRPKFQDEPNYYEIWFSFNKNHAYAETKMVYRNGSVQKNNIQLGFDPPPQKIEVVSVPTAPTRPKAKKKVIKTMAEIRAERRKK